VELERQVNHYALRNFVAHKGDLSMLLISPSAIVSKLADIEDSVRGSKIIIEDEARVDSFVKIKPAGGTGDVRIGKNSYINSGCVIYSGNGVDIGNSVLVAANCTFASTNHEFASRSTVIRLQGFQPSRGGIIVEDDVWIGAGAVLLDGAILRQGCIIGANSLVKGEVEAYSINVGNPLRRVGYRDKP
jgi:virginiamycin A acetyltransferase